MRALILILIIAVSSSCYAADELKIATWNIQWLNSTDARGMVAREPLDYKKLSAYAKSLDADIVALQEVDGQLAAERVFNPKKYNFYFSYRNNVQRTGFAVKKHIEVNSFTDYLLIGLANPRLRHGGILKAQVGEEELTLFNVHLKSGCFSNDLVSSSNKSCVALSKQLLLLKQWMNSQQENNQATIILGDFNRRLTVQDDFWRVLNLGFGKKNQLSDLAMQNSPQCWDGGYDRFIDHIVVNSVARDHLVDDSFEELVYDSEDQVHKISDHCPISIEMNFSTT